MGVVTDGILNMPFDMAMDDKLSQRQFYDTVRSEIADLRAALTAALSQSEAGQEGAHPDDIAVDRFATAMKAKLAKKRAEGRGGWEGPTCNAEILSIMLRKHVRKGDPVDVANLAMMLHQRGEGIV